MADGADVASSVGRDAAQFLSKNPEKDVMNQYWYSEPTIRALVAEVVEHGGRAAFLSTPSLYFSCPEATRLTCHVFDFDTVWSKDRGFVRYDFNAPLDFPAELKGAFDMVVIDPPFITHEVWRQYARTARALLGADPDAAGPLPDGKRVIGTTIAENTDLLAAELGLRRAVFRPSIPHLVYQYEVFVNFEPVHLAVPNPEIPADD